MKTRIALAWILTALGLSACEGSKQSGDTGAPGDGVAGDLPDDGTGGSVGDSGGAEGSEPTGDWAFSVSGPEAIQAGELATYVVRLTDPGGADVTGEAEITLSADSDAITIDGLSATGTLPGDYAVTASAEAGGERWEEVLPLAIGPGDPAEIALVVEPSSVAAGAVVTATWAVTDSYGNPLDPEVELSASSPDLAVSGAELQTGLAGDYIVTALVSGTAVFDTATLEVLPGAAATLDLVLDGYEAELGESLGYAVALSDAYGNTLDSSAVAITTSPDGVDISPGALSFTEEGIFDVTAAIDGLSDTEGPVTVDSNGPLIRVDSPARGDYGSTAQIFVEGVITDAVTGVVSAELNGSALSLEKDGSFRQKLRMDPGTNFIAVSAVDGDGNASDLDMAVMYSDTYLEDGAEVEDMLDIHAGQDGLSALAASAGDQIDLGAIEDGLIASNPVYDSDFDWACAYLSEAYLQVDIEGLDYADFAVDMRADTGELIVDVSLSDLVIDVGGDYALCFGNNALNTQLTADEALIEVALEIAVSSRGRISAEVASTSVTLINFDADFDSLNTLVDVLSTLGLDLETLIQDILEEELTAAIESELPPVVEDMLDLFEIRQTIDLVSTTALMTAAPRDIVLSSDGMTIIMDGDVSPSATDGGLPEVPGSVLMVASHPEYTGDPEVELALSADAINRVLHAAWLGGAFSLSLSDSDLGLDAATIGAIFPGATSLSMEVFPQQAPTVSPGTGAGMLDLAVGELQIEAYGDVGGVDTWLATISVQAAGSIDLSLDGDAVAMEATELLASFDVHVDEATDVAAAEQLEDILDAFAGGLAAELLPEVAFAIPEIAGITLSPVGTEVLGADDDWIGVQLDIE